jgi:hypothetical protein
MIKFGTSLAELWAVHIVVLVPRQDGGIADRKDRIDKTGGTIVLRALWVSDDDTGRRVEAEMVQLAGDVEKRIAFVVALEPSYIRADEVREYWGAARTGARGGTRRSRTGRSVGRPTAPTGTIDTVCGAGCRVYKVPGRGIVVQEIQGREYRALDKHERQMGVCVDIMDPFGREG